MPTYDYHCESCGQDFTVLQKISDTKPLCPQGGASSVAKKLSAPAVHGASKASRPDPLAGCGYTCRSTSCGCKH
jgi:putative FmdB family regulatory protein